MSDRRLAVSFLPGTAVLEMTYACNHKCLFCSCPWENPDSGFVRQAELTTDEWIETISTLCRMGVTRLAFTGGEPLLRPDIFEIIHHAAHCSVEHIETVKGRLESHQGPPLLYLLSNGTAVNETILLACKEYDVQLSMSLPGLRTYARHTGVESADHILRMFTLAKSMGMVTVVNSTVTRINLFELADTLSAALLAGAEQVLLNRFLPGGRGMFHADELSLDIPQIQQMLDTAEATLEKAGRFGSVGTEIPKCIADISRYKRLQVGTRCSAAIQYFVVGPSGRVRVCNHSPVQLNHVREIESLQSNEYWNRFVFKKYMPSVCSDCRDFTACDGGCREAAHVVTGSTCGLDPALLQAGPLGVLHDRPSSTAAS